LHKAEGRRITSTGRREQKKIRLSKNKSVDPRIKRSPHDIGEQKVWSVENAATNVGQISREQSRLLARKTGHESGVRKALCRPRFNRGTAPRRAAGPAREGGARGPR